MALFETASLLIRINFKTRGLCLCLLKKDGYQLSSPENTLRSWMLIWLDTVIYFINHTILFQEDMHGSTMNRR